MKKIIIPLVILMVLISGCSKKEEQFGEVRIEFTQEEKKAIEDQKIILRNNDVEVEPPINQEAAQESQDKTRVFSYDELLNKILTVIEGEEIKIEKEIKRMPDGAITRLENKVTMDQFTSGAILFSERNKDKAIVEIEFGMIYDVSMYAGDLVYLNQEKINILLNGIIKECLSDAVTEDEVAIITKNINEKIEQNEISSFSQKHQGKEIHFDLSPISTEANQYFVGLKIKL